MAQNGAELEVGGGGKDKQVDIEMEQDNTNMVDQIENTSSSSLCQGQPRRGLNKIITQYEAYKKAYPGHVVLMQVGDFFEIFGEDAERASAALEIGLCSTKKYQRAMTGFPVRSLETYLERLVRAGIRAVICEQFERVGAHNTRLFHRQITRIVTPGTLTEEGLLESGSNNFLLAVVRHERGQYGLAWMDISTGFFRLLQVDQEEELMDELLRINPIEIVACDRMEKDPNLLRFVANNRATLSATLGDADGVEEIYRQIFGVYFDPEALKVFSEAELTASAGLLRYVATTQLDKRPYIEFPTRFDRRSTMLLDAAALKSLELLKNNSSNTKENSLLDVIDLTCTAAGSRLLMNRLQTPLTDLARIEERLDLVEYFVRHWQVGDELRGTLSKCKDLERCFQRLALSRGAGGPRDMQVIQQTLMEAAKIRSLLQGTLSPLLSQLVERLMDCTVLIERLQMAIVDAPPYRASEGGVIRAKYSTQLDGLRGGARLLDEQRTSILERYRSVTGKSTLRFTDRKTLGWLLELPRSEGQINDPRFVLDSQLDNKYRYRTSELEELNRTFANRGDEALCLEMQLYEELRQMIVQMADRIISTAKTIAELDVATSLALLARRRNYIRPVLTEGLDFVLEGARHAVVEAKHADQGRSFVQNSANLGANSRFAFITGPNMGGKSTFLRQNALIAIMAQVGMFVPARSATIGLVDAIYTRIGASDDLSRDRSTFMMEMMETASILRHATRRSLVIMDEIGRGTAADEGLALAWGICEHLYHSIQCRTLFATHYSELASLVRSFPSSRSLMTTAIMGDDPSKGEIVFLHQIVEGVAERSHALDIARLAGIPESVLASASRWWKEGRKTNGRQA